MLATVDFWESVSKIKDLYINTLGAWSVYGSQTNL